MRMCNWVRKPGGQAGRRRALGLLCLFFALFCGCAENAGEKTAICNADPNSPFPQILSRLLPDYAALPMENLALTHLRGGAAVEAFETQALTALEIGAAKYWYPQYLTTLVIAVDRAQTDAVITGWRGLSALPETVSFPATTFDDLMALCALAYGLEGEGYTLSGAAALLSGLREQGRLARDNFDAPILICYDYQAAFLQRRGRDLEIVLPSEGTFSYVKGLLSNEPLQVSPGSEALLLEGGLRLPDGRSDPLLYPPGAAYAPAARVSDFSHLNAALLDGTRTLRRSVYHSRVYTSTDAREHQFFVLAYILLIALWTVSVAHRTMQKGVRRTAIFIGVLLIGWIIVRLLKWQITSENALTRYLWYSYYLFQLLLPLALLHMALQLGKPDEQASPRWFRALALAGGLLIALVYTNDLHGLVFRLDLSRPDWSSVYEYGPGFYIVLFGMALPLVIAVALLLIRSAKNPRKTGLAFPLGLCALLAAYGYGYIARVPLAWESDVTMVVGIFALLFLESSIRSGLIPANTQYARLFAHSPLHMRILDAAGETALASAGGAVPDADALLFSHAVTGGQALWQEDISSLNRLRGELADAAKRLEAANNLLLQEEKVQRSLHAAVAREALAAQIEAELAPYRARLSGLLSEAPNGAGKRALLTRTALLLCFIKRRYQLFFREGAGLSAQEIALYMEELADVAQHAQTRVLPACAAGPALSPRGAVLLLSFFYEAVDAAIAGGCAHLLASLEWAEGGTALRLLPSEDMSGFHASPELARAIDAAGGRIIRKDLDEVVGISLLLPEGGGADA